MSDQERSFDILLAMNRVYNLPKGTKIYRAKATRTPQRWSRWQEFITTRSAGYSSGELVESWDEPSDSFIMEVRDSNWTAIKILFENIDPIPMFFCPQCKSIHNIRKYRMSEAPDEEVFRGIGVCIDCWIGDSVHLE